MSNRAILALTAIGVVAAIATFFALREKPARPEATQDQTAPPGASS